MDKNAFIRRMEAEDELARAEYRRRTRNREQRKMVSTIGWGILLLVQVWRAWVAPQDLATQFVIHHWMFVYLLALAIWESQYLYGRVWR